MARRINALYKDGEVRPLEPVNLPDETRLTIVVVDGSDKAKELPVSVRRVDPLATLHLIAEDAGPPDLATNLDHYLYGTSD